MQVEFSQIVSTIIAKQLIHTIGTNRSRVSLMNLYIQVKDEDVKIYSADGFSAQRITFKHTNASDEFELFISKQDVKKLFDTKKNTTLTLEQHVISSTSGYSCLSNEFTYPSIDRLFAEPKAITQTPTSFGQPFLKVIKGMPKNSSFDVMIGENYTHTYLIFDHEKEQYFTHEAVLMPMMRKK
jgi:DNA polymerase III sliding clamp (beta) subunit (PCNA family)